MNKRSSERTNIKHIKGEKLYSPLLLPPAPAAAVVGGAKPTGAAAAAAAAALPAAVAAALGCSTKTVKLEKHKTIEIEVRYPQQLRIKEENNKQTNKKHE